MWRTLTMLFIAALIVAATTGCQSTNGGKEFIPGKGWRPVK